jgi:carboxyl-terminal processing protease
MRRRRQRRIASLCFTAAVGVCALALGVRMGRHSALPTQAASDPYTFFDTLVDIRAQIVRNYVEPVDEAKLQRGAIQGMLGELDPFSNYFSKDELIAFDKQTHGQFSGIGAEFAQDPNTGALVIVSPLEDSPALKAGVMAGDRILKIDGQSTTGLSLKDLFSAMGGAPGTVVHLTVLHDGDKSPVTLTVTRDVVKVQSVKGVGYGSGGGWDFVIDPEHRIAYVRITTFMESTAEDLDKALLPLFAQPGGLKGIILDLRYNPGGLLTQAIEVSDRFLESGVIVSTRGRDGKDQFVAEAKKEGTYPHVPLVVLVNEFSASASEIVAGALKDHHRAVLIGTRTFGKGSVQNLITLDGGQSALKLTTAYYYLPSGRNIMRKKDSTTWGVEPDAAFVIPLTDDENRAVLLARSKSEIIRPRRSATQPSAASSLVGDTPDKQLQRAVEVLIAYQSFSTDTNADMGGSAAVTRPSASASIPAAVAPAAKPAVEATRPATMPVMKPVKIPAATAPVNNDLKPVLTVPKASTAPATGPGVIIVAPEPATRAGESNLPGGK